MREGEREGGREGERERERERGRSEGGEKHECTVWTLRTNTRTHTYIVIPHVHDEKALLGMKHLK